MSERGEAAGLLVGFHGYAETAEDHLEQLGRIPGADAWHRVAVQALHPFYTRAGQVVAGWMTRLDRELAMEDNLRYVAAVVGRLAARFPGVHRLVFSGFSQGVAMAYRAAAGCGRPCHGLVALAGDVPPDVAGRPLPGFPPVLLGRGTGDEWYTEEKMTADLEVLGRHGIEVNSHVFEGGHVWEESFLAATGDFLGRLATGAATPVSQPAPTTRSPG